jgi:hypothetical protein
MAEYKQLLIGVRSIWTLFDSTICDMEMSCGVFQSSSGSRQCNFVDTDFVLRRVIGLRLIKWPGIMPCGDAC